MSKTRAEAQTELRDKKRAQGMVLKQVFVWPQDWASIKQYIDLKNAKRGKA